MAYSEYYVKSTNVRVFPCAYRNPQFNQEANLTTEYNMRHTTANSLSKSKKDTYIINKVANKLICFIGGYYFEFNGTLPSNCNYILIKLANKPFIADSNDNTIEESYVLDSWATSLNSTNTNEVDKVLDTTDPSDTSGEHYFTGAKFVADLPSSSDEYDYYLAINAPSSNFGLVYTDIESKASGSNIIGDFYYNNSAIEQNGTFPINVHGKLVADDSVELGKYDATDSTNIINKKTTVKGSFETDKDAIINGSATLKSTLGVTGATTLNSTLDVTGATTLNNTLNANGNVTIGTADSKVSTTINGTLTVTGNSNLADLIIINSDAKSIGIGSANVSTTTSINSTTTINGSLTVKSGNNTIFEAKNESNTLKSNFYGPVTIGVDEATSNSPILTVWNGVKIYHCEQTSGAINVLNTDFSRSQGEIDITIGSSNANLIIDSNTTFNSTITSTAAIATTNTIAANSLTVNTNYGINPAGAGTLSSLSIGGDITPSNLSSIGSDNYKFANAYFSGTVKASTFDSSSDKRLKENIVEYKAEKSILNLPIYKYDFINGYKNQIGCLAQDLQEICPEIVHEDENGYLSIQESKIVYLLLDEVKKLKEEIKELKK